MVMSGHLRSWAVMKIATGAWGCSQLPLVGETGLPVLKTFENQLVAWIMNRNMNTPGVLVFLLGTI